MRLPLGEAAVFLTEKVKIFLFRHPKSGKISTESVLWLSQMNGKGVKTMIEIIQKREEEAVDHDQEPTLKSLPKNFRQIGTPTGVKRIYVEDFVYTYLHNDTQKMKERRVCILAGRIEKTKECLCLYVSGAFELKDLDYQDFVPVFNEAVREEICLLMKQHFPESDMLGWFFDEKGVTPRLTPELEQIHKKFFGGNNRILFLSDSLEKEENVYLYEDQVTHRQGGYYIYYEKNERMQDYMISSREDTPEEVKPEEVRDEAMKSYRQMFLHQEEQEKPSKNRVLYGAGTVVVLALCIVGISLFNNYHKMKNMEETMAAMAGSLATEREAETRVVVEEVSGGVQPLETETQNENVAVEETTENAGDETAETAVSTETGQETEPVDETVSDSESGAVEENGASTTDAAAEVVNREGASPEQGYYIVQDGDSLTSICQQFYQDITKVDELCQANDIDEADKIYAGEKLILP